MQYCAESVQGGRRHMEDRHVSVAHGDAEFHAVYDGHGGAEAADFLAAELHPETFRQLQRLPERTPERVEAAVRRAFDLVNGRLRTQRGLGPWVGSTATVLLLWGGHRHALCAGVGDSEAVLLRRGEGASPLVRTHKPDHPDELRRIQRAGGFVEAGRVDGRLAMSRSFGDFGYGAKVTCVPDCRYVRLRPAHEGFVLATDGVWDEVAHEEAARVRGCAELVALAQRRGSQDNATALAVPVAPPADAPAAAATPDPLWLLAGLGALALLAAGMRVPAAVLGAALALAALPQSMKATRMAR